MYDLEDQITLLNEKENAHSPAASKENADAAPNGHEPAVPKVHAKANHVNANTHTVKDPHAKAGAVHHG